MKKYFSVFMFFFIVSFFMTTNIKADYKATAINPSGASCNLRAGSTGFCYYENSNLNSYVSGVVWLDTGDEVTVITSKSHVATKDKNLCSDYYVYTSYYSPLTKKTHYGYYCNSNLSSNALTDELKEEFKSAGFSESYFEKLAILKSAHPKWTFKAINTNLNFSDAVNGEINKAGWSLVQRSSSNNYAYMAIDSASFDYYNDKFIPYDDKSSSNAWYNANYDTVAYYMDPRNFLNDMYVFQFEGLAYDSSISDDTLKDTINEVFKGDYLSKFTMDFINAGKESKVSPVYLASLSKQEVGIGEVASTAVLGEYNGMFNFYNIGATGGTNPALKGLDFAAIEDLETMRPWDTEYKAIVGGALWMSDKYMNAGQDTSYFKKWNVIYNYLIATGKIKNPYSNFTHQYMTNIMAPTSEAKTTQKSYSSSGLIDSGFIFYIPVYKNMPDKTNLPTKGGWPNNYLESITINGVNVAGFDGAVTDYNYYLDINEPKLTLAAKTKSSTASINGIGTFDITSDTTKTIKVTAQNGNVKNYNIKIILTGTKLEDPIDVKTTLNNAGIKNGNEYITGLNLETDISYIKDKILNANSSAKVSLKDSSNKEKNTGIIKTGDTITVTVGEDVKDFKIVVYGDVSGDGKIDALDFIRIKKSLLNQITLSGANREAADISKDGKVDALDFVRIKKYMLGNLTSIVQ